jgi:hypothetical protein
MQFLDRQRSLQTAGSRASKGDDDISLYFVAMLR